jgi:DNA primase large subunit
MTPPSDEPMTAGGVDAALCRKQAAQCRRVAKLVLDQAVASELLRYAGELDGRADTAADAI